MRKDKESEEPEPIVTPGKSFEDVVFEQIAGGSFLRYDRVTQQTSTNSLIVHEGIAYKPMGKIPWPTASLPEVLESEDPLTKEQLLQKLAARRFQGDYGDTEHLFNEIKAFFMEHLDVRNELLFDVYASFVLMSWRMEDFKVVPYQMFLGPLASGKTRGLECFRYLGYRALSSVTMSAASIFRTLEAWHCLLLLDETEVYGRESMVEVLALLNAGYRRGQYAIRIEKLEGEVPQIAMFDTFGPKVLAGTEELAATLQSRAILTTMSRNVRHVRLFVDEEKAQELRNKLLMYRFRNLGCKSEFDVSTLNGYFSNSRVIELFVSLLEVAPTQEVRDRLVECMREITQTREDAEQASVEARVFEAILKCEDRQEKGRITTQTITEVFNSGLSENEQEKSWFIGRKVTALGFEKCRVGSSGKAGYFWDKKLIERLKARYGTLSKTPSEPTEPSEPTADMEKQHGQTKLNTEGTEGCPTVSMLSDNHDSNVNTVGSVGTEGSEGSLEVLAKNTLSLQRLTGLFEDKCIVCSFQGALDWQVSKFDGSWGLLCDQCGLELEKRLNKNE